MATQQTLNRNRRGVASDDIPEREKLLEKKSLRHPQPRAHK